MMEMRESEVYSQGQGPIFNTLGSSYTSLTAAVLELPSWVVDSLTLF